MKSSLQKSILIIIQNTCVIFTLIIMGLLVIGNGKYLGPETIWQVFVVSFLCSLTSGIGFIERITFWLRFVIHLVFVLSINIGGGFLFGWFRGTDPILPFVVAIMVVVIFSIVYIIMYFNEKQSINKLNKALEQFKRNEG